MILNLNNQKSQRNQILFKDILLKIKKDLISIALTFYVIMKIQHS